MTKTPNTKEYTSVTRRDWLATATLTAAGIGVCLPSATAQVSALESTLKNMQSITGLPLSEKSAASVTALVGVILESSKGLRDLDLDGFEPATSFQAE